MGFIKRSIKETDWIFLIFLLIFLNQSNFSLKTIGILFIYIARPNLKFGLMKGRMPLFYLLIIGISVLNYLLFIRDFSFPYFAAFGMAMLLWTYSFLAFHQIKLSVEKYGSKSYTTICVFTVLNFIFSILQLGNLIRITGKLNPYRGLDFPYGLSSGDNIYGIYMQNSLYNVMTCAMLAIYFLYKKNYLLCLLSVTTLMLVFANTDTIIFIVALTLILIVGLVNILVRNKGNNSFVKIIENATPPGNFALVIVALFIYIGILSFIISPENITYTAKSFVSKINQGTSKEEKKKFFEMEQKSISFNKNEIIDNSDSVPEEKRNDSIKVVMPVRQNYHRFFNEKVDLSNQYVHNFKGKKLSLMETYQYLISSPATLFMGAGPVRFSSLTAQKMSGYDSSRIFMKILPHFSTREYEENHKLLIKVRVENPPQYRSSINWPDCFANQLFGEYGIIGFLLFLIFYIYYFVKRIRFWTYGFGISMMLVPFSFFCYVFEPFSVIIIYELLMLIDMKSIEEKQNRLSLHQ